MVIRLWLCVTAKPGQCPPVDPETLGLCAEFCSSDADCTGNSKCCSNGCGHSCQTPGMAWYTFI